HPCPAAADVVDQLRLAHRPPDGTPGGDGSAGAGHFSRSASALSISLAWTLTSLRSCLIACSSAFSTASLMVRSPMTSRAAWPARLSSPSSLTAARDRPPRRWPARPPAAPSTAAEAMIDGGNRTPSTPPAARPHQAPLRVEVSSLLTWILPLSSLVTTAAS